MSTGEKKLRNGAGEEVPACVRCGNACPVAWVLHCGPCYQIVKLEAERDALRARVEAVTRDSERRRMERDAARTERDQLKEAFRDGQLRRFESKYPVNSHAWRLWELGSRIESYCLSTQVAEDACRSAVAKLKEVTRERDHWRDGIDRVGDVLGVPEHQDEIGVVDMAQTVISKLAAAERRAGEAEAKIARYESALGKAASDSLLCDVCGVRPSAIGGYCADCDVINHAIETGRVHELPALFEQRKRRNPLSPSRPDDGNQCDGCRAGKPVDERGFHRMGDGEYADFMACQKSRYSRPDDGGKGGA